MLSFGSMGHGKYADSMPASLRGRAETCQGCKRVCRDPYGGTGTWHTMLSPGRTGTQPTGKHAQPCCRVEVLRQAVVQRGELAPPSGVGLNAEGMPMSPSGIVEAQ